MADPDYVDTLADQLCTRHTALIATVEDDLALHRARFALVVAFIHNPDHDRTARVSLAHDLDLPGPR